MAKSKSKPALSKAQSAQLAKITSKGLYKRKKKGAVTPGQVKYQKSIIAKFFDVASGNSAVVKTNRATVAKYKTSSPDVGQLRTKGTRVIVPVQEGEKVTFSPKQNKVRAILKAGRDRYIREPFEGRISNWRDIEKQLRPSDRVAVPFYRGKKKPLSWHDMTQEEFRGFWNEYGRGGSHEALGPDGRMHPRLYEGLERYIEISRFEGEHAAPGVANELSEEERGLKVGPQLPKQKRKRRAKRKTKLL